MHYRQFPMERGVRTLLSLLLVGLLVLQSSWFFLFMFLMAGAMVFSGIYGSRREWLTWIGMLIGVAVFADLRARMGPIVEAHTFFQYPIHLETLGGALVVPTVWLQNPLLSGFLEAPLVAVYLSYFLVPQLVAIFLWREGGPFPRYVVAACLLFGTALLVHFFLPTAPPWMASQEGVIPAIDRVIIRVLSETFPELTAGGYAASANDVAAMPSVHQGLTVLAMIALGKHDPRTRLTGWLYATLMLFAITYLGEHYVVDGLAGAAVAWGAWTFAGKFQSRSSHTGTGIRQESAGTLGAPGSGP